MPTGRAMPHLGDASNILLPPITKLASNMSDINLNGQDDGLNGGSNSPDGEVLGFSQVMNGHSNGTASRSPQVTRSVGSLMSSSTATSATNEHYLTCDHAFKLYHNILTNFEKQEIFSYSQIYCVGSRAKKIQATFNGPMNGGYDTENGSYHHVIHDHIAYRYEVLKIIGKGSFGQVVKAYDHKTHTYVGLKTVRNEKRFHKQADEEIKILEHLKRLDHDNSMNIIHMLDNFVFRNHKCITFELLSMNLYELIKKNRFQGFSLQLVRKFAHGILQCLDALYRQKIIHCDLKPENVLLKQPGRSGIKVIDFGSSCFEHERIYSYIQSRFYRAPEVILGGRYGMAIDMWSFGCILAELYTGFPLLPGEDEGDQLAAMIELLGMPPESMLETCKRSRSFFSSKGIPRYCCVTTNVDGHALLSGTRNKRGKYRGPPNSKDLATGLKGCDDTLFLDFIRRCLDWDPTTRMTPPDAVRHQWLKRRLPRPPGNGESLGAKSQVLAQVLADRANN
ncbi:dual specificity tyrosine-phosphorylation-regulated kinase 2-like [Paramacrobiotus metropolitanus]|uniref:dual specificity tyrosine-phosphorylation-regulated kinase 2-like n=1 Tax=Paramacrobiotus metropolitanus TaxID=2943436 RepID=UPI002445BD9F|nr:dual specificity tyrosine-phosphorylation-regulated kinase 2-like [Paramacrobiotus metropolitanus]XP_055338143.1 dual specificity tyrosine-phosphorylation-regulated kinase 2-like [Paramacrobiotus metropolitanus]XP_055338144.1 dual specificity tyrosine-phosphorylation-regulated kinase 2-like [Paramacrobiotus metropolitanus]XP_055338145.1 dual specificity tyrosine-phosphorylation-regulated kinase 2-like [Paramacrobiotus metropolitanus]XP_055338146.1 dual specificity tyrosine-phosphorylation-re